MALVPFHTIQVNAVAFEGPEVVFPYEGKWYRMDWADVPDRFKQLYVVSLRLQGISVPSALQEYIVDTIDVATLDIDFDLTKAQEVDEEYPV